MGSHWFYYDDCRSADRLAREWTQISGDSSLVVEYQTDIGKFAYSVTRTGSSVQHNWRWDAAISGVDFDAIFLFKKYGNPFGLMFDVFDINNWCSVFKSDKIYIYRRFGGAQYYKFFNAVIADNVWYYWRVRKVGKDVRSKFWQYGTSEPDWMHTNLFTVPDGYNENPVRFQPRGVTRFGICAWLPSTGSWSKIADIRITPVRRGGS